MTTEQDRAQMEAERNAAEDEYFAARPLRARDTGDYIFAAGYERGWNERNKKVMELQELLDAITVGYFPTQDQLREWEQRWQAKRMDELENQVALSLDLTENRRNEIESLRARNEELELKVITCRMMRYAEAYRCNAETERCAKIASDYGMSPVVGKAIAALIMEGR